MDPYRTLGLPDDAGDELIRRRYLELVRQHPPEQQPERFAKIRAAYEELQDLTKRVERKLFPRTPPDSIDEIVEEYECQIPPRRFTLEELVRATRSRP